MRGSRLVAKLNFSFGMETRPPHKTRYRPPRTFFRKNGCETVIFSDLLLISWLNNRPSAASQNLRICDPVGKSCQGTRRPNPAPEIPTLTYAGINTPPVSPLFSNTEASLLP